MSRVWGILLIVLVARSGSVSAQRSCLGEFTALQISEVFDPRKPRNLRYKLKSERAGKLFETAVVLQAQPEPQNPALIKLSVSFDRDFQGVSLPYNIFALMVVRDGEVIGWWDYTNSCTEPPLSFYPGREIQLPIFKLIGERPQKLQIMVWGKL